MRENISGINEHLIDKLVIEIMDYADKANKVLNQIQELVDGTTLYMSSPCGTAFRTSFSALEQNYQTMNQNILNYAKDFVKVKEVYKTQVLNVVDTVNKATGNK